MFKTYSKILLATSLCFLFLSCGSEETTESEKAMNEMQFEAHYSHSKSLYEEGTASLLNMKYDIGANLAIGDKKLKISSLTMTYAAMEEIDKASIQLIKTIHNEKKKILARIECESALERLDPNIEAPALLDGRSLTSDKEDLFNSMKLQENIIEFRNYVVERVTNSHPERKENEYKYSNRLDGRVLNNLRLKGDDSDLKHVRSVLSDASPDDIDGLTALVLAISPRAEEDRTYSAIEALHFLCIQEARILDARKCAFQLFKYRYSFCGDSVFDKITTIALGPSHIGIGDSVELQVMIAALEWDNDPIITCEQNATVEIKDGIGYLNLKVDQTTTVKGTIGVRNKVGALKTSEWEKKIVVR